MRLSNTHLSRIAEYAVLGLLFVAVLWRGGKSLDATWLLSLVAGLVTYYWYWKGRDEVPALERREVAPLIIAAIVAFLLWSIASYVFSTTQNYGLDELMRDVSCALLFFWIVRQGNGKDRRGLSFIEKFMMVLSVATLLACIVGVLVYVFQPVNRFVGTFFDYRFQTDYWPNAWAEFLLLAWPVVLHTAMKKHVPIAWGFLVLGFVFACLLLSYSRGAFIAFVGQVGLLGLLNFDRLKAAFFPHGRFSLTLYGKKIFFSAFFLLVLAVSFFLFINSVRSRFYDVQDVSDKVTFSSAEGESSISERREFWSQAWTLLRERPLFGWGPYSFRFVQPQLETEILATSDHPHNVFLKIGMERGMIAALLLVAIFGLLIARGRSLKLYRQHFSHALLATGIIGVLAHNLIDYNLQFVGIALPFWLMLGVLTRDTTLKGSLPSRAIRTADLLLALLLLVTVFIEGSFLLTSSLGRHAQAKGDDSAAFQWYERSRHEFFSRDLHLSRALLFLKQHRLPEAQAALDDYLARNAEDGRAWLIQGDIDVAHDDFRAAATAYDSAYRILQRNDLTAPRSLLQVLAKTGNRRELDERKDSVIALLRQYADAIERNAHFIALSDNVEEFLKIAKLLSGVYPDEAPKLDILGAAVDRHAKEERAKISARAPGYLW